MIFDDKVCPYLTGALLNLIDPSYFSNLILVTVFGSRSTSRILFGFVVVFVEIITISRFITILFRDFLEVWNVPLCQMTVLISWSYHRYIFVYYHICIWLLVKLGLTCFALVVLPIHSLQLWCGCLIVPLVVYLRFVLLAFVLSFTRFFMSIYNMIFFPKYW